MEIFGYNIEKIQEEPIVPKGPLVHMAIVSTKRGRKILYIDGAEIKEKDFTFECWIKSKILLRLNKKAYTKYLIEKGMKKCKN